MGGRARRMLRDARKRGEGPSEGEGELNIVPFLDIVVNLMLFLLATSTATMAMAEVEVDLPGACRHCDGRGTLGLTVMIADDGFIVAGEGGRLRPGCRAVGGGGLTVRGRDFDALRACATRIHAAYPAERAVTLSAAPEVPYQDVIATMDALRGSEAGLLFPDVLLAAGVR